MRANLRLVGFRDSRALGDRRCTGLHRDRAAFDLRRPETPVDVDEFDGLDEELAAAIAAAPREEESLQPEAPPLAPAEAPSEVVAEAPGIAPVIIAGGAAALLHEAAIPAAPVTAPSTPFVYVRCAAAIVRGGRVGIDARSCAQRRVGSRCDEGHARIRAGNDADRHARSRCDNRRAGICAGTCADRPAAGRPLCRFIRRRSRRHRRLCALGGHGRGNSHAGAATHRPLHRHRLARLSWASGCSLSSTARAPISSRPSIPARRAKSCAPTWPRPSSAKSRAGARISSRHRPFGPS